MQWERTCNKLNGPGLAVRPASQHTRIGAGEDRKAQSRRAAFSPWPYLGPTAQYYRRARGRHRRVRCMYDVSSFVGRLVLKRIVVHLQSLLVVVWLEHELEHTWPGIGL